MQEVQVSTAHYLTDLRHALDDVPHGPIEALVALLVDAAGTGKTVFAIGNGGSAATASHLACDLGKGTRPLVGPSRAFRT